MVDSGQPLSRSLLWSIQRQYYENQGVEAWRANIVPSYITSNPYIAQSYARVVLGYLRDLQPSLDPEQPVYLLELGAGGGRFAFYFMRSFMALLAQSPFPELNFTYVLTDLPERNVAFWQQHPAFQDWVAVGRLDFARFDALNDRQIQLRQSGRIIAPGEPKNPLIFLANYFFDSLPNDAFHIEDGKVQECLIKLTTKEADLDLSATDVLARLKIHFLTQEGDRTGYYQDADLDSVLEQYRVLENSYLLFCADAIRLVRGLMQLSGGHMLLVSGDYGLTRVQDWDQNGAPDIRIHGSISMEVNYHALGAFVQNQGGRFFSPGFYSQFLTVCALVMGDHSEGYGELGMAYSQAIEQYGPNDFFLLKRGMERAYTVMTLDEVLAFLRFSGWDAHLFLDLFADLLEKLPKSEARTQQELLNGMYALWDNYYHLGETRDLPFNIGVVFFRLGRPGEALPFFERSLADYGTSQLTLYNIALCLTQQQKYSLAWSRVKQALSIDPEFEPALELLEELKKHHPMVTEKKK